MTPLGAALSARIRSLIATGLAVTMVLMVPGVAGAAPADDARPLPKDSK